ncbi:hypothetical protein GQ53DRAFT_130025 [Thozetella sp. PMI_491]|nr:hypothetical protein GQ53DRAFT_130025 [Thozetella sp. PMI_491]
MPYTCVRAILSCSRCRKRKIKCDRKIPTCTPCVKAEVDCLGVSSIEDDIPRSLLQSLESEIAELEAELATGDAPDTTETVTNSARVVLGSPMVQSPLDGEPQESNIDQPYHLPAVSVRGSGDEVARAAVLSSSFMQAMISTVMPSGSASTDLLIKVRLGMTPSLTQLRQSSSVNAAKSNQGSSGLGANALRSIPPDIARALVRKYTTSLHPHYPFLSPTSLWEHFSLVSGVIGWSGRTRLADETPTPCAIPPSHDFLIVYLVLAISVTLGIADASQEGRCMSLSASLFTEGIEHFCSLSSCTSDLTWLQAILLMLLYATILPRSANVWVLSGAAMRACVEFGLHRERPYYIEESGGTQAKEARRMLFWSAYCMDRNICSALQRPLSTPDAAINLELPRQGAGAVFLFSIQYHQLLSEITQMHFQDHKLPDGVTWELWLASLEHRLRHWHATYPRDVLPICSIDFSLSRGLMMLHRPSPRIRLPSESSLLLAFEAACSSARHNRDEIRSGFLRRPWLSAHHTLEAAMVVLFSLRHGHHVIKARFRPTQVFDMTKLLTANFLDIADQGWPEVSDYAGVYERLLGSLLEPVLSNTATLQFSVAQDAELMRLLYPGPAQLEKLRLGQRAQQDETWQFDSTMWDMAFDFLSFDSIGDGCSAHDD